MRTAVFETPPTVAVIVAEVVVETGLVAIAKVARFAVGFTDTEVGTIAPGEFEASVTVIPELPAASGTRTNPSEVTPPVTLPGFRS